MRRAIGILAAAVVAIAIVRGRADACVAPNVSPYEAFDRATTVAVVRVRSIPPLDSKGYRSKGDVLLDVDAVLEGDSVATLVAFEEGPTCGAAFAVGETGIVFLRGTRVVGAFYGFVREVTRWRATLDAWAAATSAEDRIGVLVDAMTSDDYDVAVTAALFVAKTRALRRQLDAAACARLKDAMAAHPKWAWALRPLARRRPRGGR